MNERKLNRRLVSKPKDTRLNPSGRQISKHQRLLEWATFIYVATMSTFILLPEPFWFLANESTGKEIADSDFVGLLLHGIAYAVLTILVLSTTRIFFPSMPTGVRTVCISLVFVHGSATELIQAFIPTRAASVIDLAADALGIGLGAVIWTRYCRRATHQ